MRNLRQIGKIRSIRSFGSVGGVSDRTSEIFQVANANPGTGGAEIYDFQILANDSFSLEILTTVGGQNNRPSVTFNVDPYLAGQKVKCTYDATFEFGTQLHRHMYVASPNTFTPGIDVVEGFNDNIGVLVAGNDGSAFNLYFDSTSLSKVTISNMKFWFIA